MVAAPPPVQKVEKQNSHSGRENAGSRQFYYRVTYKKGKEVRYVSHRNLINIFHRAFSAARIPVAYSKGFHPHPRIAFGQPLAVGFIGEAELFDVITTRQVEINKDTLKEWLPRGLDVLKCRLLVKKPVSLNAASVAARYSLVPVTRIDEEELVRAVTGVMKKKSLPVKVEKKGKTVEMDIRPGIYSMTVEKNYGMMYLQATLSMLPGKTCRPAHLIPCLFSEKDATDFMITRLACLQEVDGKLKELQ
jgi:radical SAM-linked protein